MPLPSSTLAAIQTAGAAIFAADAALKTSAQDYADQVKLAMLQNPFDLGNDTLFEDWKTVARLAQAITQIEAEFRKIYGAASDLSAGSRAGFASMPSLASPQGASSEELEVVSEIQATDAVIKMDPVKLRRARGDQPTHAALRGNALTLLERLVQILNTTEFVKLNRMAVANEVGLPRGSIGAAISKLVQSGYLMEGPSGSFKLTARKVH
jgi:hypothetical protein